MQAEGDGNPHEFHYWATWARIVSGEFTVTYPVTKRGGKSYFGGRHHLGDRFGGTFTHEAVATATSYDATYSAMKDRGEFHMKRP